MDIDRMERVLVNLLSNAARFTPVGGRIEIGVSLADERATIWVQDSGPGFPAARRRRGSSSASTRSESDSAGNRDRSAAARASASRSPRSSWTCTAETSDASSSCPGRARSSWSRCASAARTSRRTCSSAARWSARSPAERRDSPLADFTRGIAARDDFRLLDIANATERRVVERDQSERDHEHTVLVVEDTPDVARLVHLTLHQTMRVFIAGDGAQGLAMAKKLRPDVIVTDLMMPVMDGLELTRRIREDEALRQIPVVMLTARGDLEDRLAGVETGVNAYLTKPFSTKELLATVRANIRRSDVAVSAAMRSQQMASLETVAGGLAHEINNPLNYIKQSLALIERDLSALAVEGPARARVETFMKTARSGVTRISGTVALMQRYAKDGYSRAPQPVDLFAMTRDVVALVAPATGSRAEVSVEVSGSGEVEGVPDELQQVLSNLVQNAIEATPEGRGRVSVRGAVEGGFVVLRVTDNGPGSGDERRLKPVERRDAVGLGHRRVVEGGVDEVVMVLCGAGCDITAWPMWMISLAW
jgi:signal transduction histidine kinase